MMGILFKYSNIEDYEMIWISGPWFFGKPFIFKKMDMRVLTNQGEINLNSPMDKNFIPSLMLLEF